MNQLNDCEHNRIVCGNRGVRVENWKNSVCQNFGEQCDTVCMWHSGHNNINVRSVSVCLVEDGWLIHTDN